MNSENYAAAFRSSPDAILLVGDDGRIREANPMAERMFGYARGELVGREIEMLVPVHARAGHAGHRHAYAHRPSARPMGIGMELIALRRDGTELPVEISLSPWRSADETLTIAAVRDVSERRRLRRFGVAALRASEAERLRIARELHDDTAQRLSALLLRLRLIERDAPELADVVQVFRGEISSSLEGVRRIARGLRPPELEDAGIAAALRAHARSLRDGTGFEVAIDVDPVDEVLEADQRLVLYRVVQEALSNAARHSGASSAEVSVRLADDHVVTSVVDRGGGFDHTALTGPDAGIGLVGMQERAAAVGGTVRVDSEPGRGTHVVLTLPVGPPADPGATPD